MLRINHRIGGLIFILFITLAFSGLAGVAQAGQKTIRFGYQQTIWGAPAIVAIQQNVFKGTGIQVKGIVLGSGKAVRDAMIGGSIDVGSVGGTPFLVGVSKADILAIGMVAYAGKTLSVVAKKGAGIKSVADLKGKKVASKVGSITDHIFQNVVAPDFGLKKGDYEIVNTRFQDHVSALVSGSVDAFAGVEPYPALAEIKGIGIKLVDFGEYDLTPLVLAAQGKLVRENPDAVIAFLKGWKKVVDIFNKDPNRPVEIVLDVFTKLGYDLSEEVISGSIGGLEVTPEYRSGLFPYFQKQAENLKAAGKIDVIPKWDKVFLREHKEKAGLK